MKGLEVAQRFFNEWGLPYLRSEFPQLSERAACFLCEGSQSLGNDDDLSRDHGWGPGFKIVLTGEDGRRFGRRLRKEINQVAPKEWLGYRFGGRFRQRKNVEVSDRKGVVDVLDGHNQADSIEVDSLNAWFRNFTRFTHPPRTTRAWDQVRETNLYMLKHATVFHDPLGEFSARREGFKYYPDENRLIRINGETFNVWHYGQYNFLNRLAHRSDPVAVTICLGEFIKATMKLCLYLNRDYAPYWKWLSAEFVKQPNVGDLAADLSGLAASHNLEEQVSLVDRICKDLYARLVSEDLVSENPTGHPDSLMCANLELKRRRLEAAKS